MIYVIGDIHGHYDTLIDLLTNDAHLIQPDLTWIGGEQTLVMIGDYVDRGPDGIRVIDFLISLQIQAEMHDGRVITLIGNHEPVLLAAQRLGTQKSNGPGGNFLEDWRSIGGVENDLLQLTPEHVAWMTHLPAMVKLDDTLFMHADAMLYLKYGQSVDEVNVYFERVMQSHDPVLWDKLREDFSERNAFHDAKQGIQRVEIYVRTFDVKRIIHGHTPIGFQIDKPHEQVTEALTYADGRCINVDGGIVPGGPGFVWTM